MRDLNLFFNVTHVIAKICEFTVLTDFTLKRAVNHFAHKTLQICRNTLLRKILIFRELRLTLVNPQIRRAVAPLTQFL